MRRLEDVANIVLRVPSILVLDLLYKCDIDSFTEHLRAKNEDMLFKYKYVIWNLYYLGHVINVVVLVLPLRHIIKLYLYILTTLLFYVGHQISKDYVHGEVQYGYDGALYLDSQAFNRFVSSLTSQVILSTLCAFLMKTRKVWLFSAHLLPLLARLCAMPHDTLLLVNSFSTVLTGIGVAMFLLSNLFVPYRLARAAYSELLQLEVPYCNPLTTVISSPDDGVRPYLFLDAPRGQDDGVCDLYHGLQSGGDDDEEDDTEEEGALQSLHKQVRSNPIILALGASRNRSLWKHFRGLSMCLVLLVFPGYMAYKISQFFHMDFWLLILVSSCMLTSLQVTGTLLIYFLFMVELFCSDPIDSLDEIIYWVNAGNTRYLSCSHLSLVINTSLPLQEMSSAVLTYCGHFFHGNCLRKWLYVQETCPMCHQAIRPTTPEDFQAAPPPSRGTGPGRAEDRRGSRDQTPGRDATHQPPVNLPSPGSPDQQEGTESLREGTSGLDREDRPGRPRREPVQDLSFSSTGDFVGFVSPGSPAGRPSPGKQNLEPWDGTQPTNRYNGGGVDSTIKELLVQSNPKEWNGRVLTRVNGATQNCRTENNLVGENQCGPMSGKTTRKTSRAKSVNRIGDVTQQKHEHTGRPRSHTLDDGHTQQDESQSELDTPWDVKSTRRQRSRLRSSSTNSRTEEEGLRHNSRTVEGGLRHNSKQRRRDSVTTAEQRRRDPSQQQNRGGGTPSQQQNREGTPSQQHLGGVVKGSSNKSTENPPHNAFFL
ncbi:RING finger protein 145 [Salvelinus sp. IW2-2015]|uniref:RING finger protein 145 n=1 Tax=Salvelinus sp. IW2-2015 TaxID=2691554 RepID=UPI0038D4B121